MCDAHGIIDAKPYQGKNPELCSEAFILDGSLHLPVFLKQFIQLRYEVREQLQECFIELGIKPCEFLLHEFFRFQGIEKGMFSLFLGDFPDRGPISVHAVDIIRAHVQIMTEIRILDLV